MATKLTASTRRGLAWIFDMANADFDTIEDDEITAKKRREIERGFDWLRTKAAPARRKSTTDGDDDAR